MQFGNGRSRAKAGRRNIALFIVLACLGLSPVVEATMLKKEKSLDWVSNRDLTSEQFARKFRQYSDRGYLMIDVDAYPVRNKLRYSMVWRKNTDGRAWAEHRDMSSAQYSEKWEHYRARGFRPLDFAVYRSGNATRYAGIWVKNKEGIGWSSRRDMTSDAYGELFQEKSSDGFRLVDMEAYTTANGLRYSAIWYKNTSNISWIQKRNMTRSTYQQEVDKQSSNGFSVVDFEVYKNGQSTRYAAIWEKVPGFSFQVRTNRDSREFANLWREYRDKGLRLIDFERLGDSYGGIWIENDERYRYGKKDNIDRKVKKYLDDNNLPGISIAVIKNGKELYRRGFGMADVNKKKVAHSRTIYNLASVSKVFGGTLAARLESKSRLSDGSAYDLDLSDSTRKYVSGLPAHHTHTVEQLLSHLGCVGHYKTNPKISNQTIHHSSSVSAVRSIQSVPLVRNCSVGKNRSYSTAAFTFVGAALEGATNRKLDKLLERELLDPLGLTDIRVQYAGRTLPVNYDRAVPYRSGNRATTYKDNSWKILGGGLEGSAYEMALFGWKILDGQVMSDDVRDNRLFSPPSNKSTNGLGWALDNKAGKRVAAHGGSWTGARTYLRLYLDDGLVIAIASNRSDHSNGNLRNLSASIAAEVFD